MDGNPVPERLLLPPASVGGKPELAPDPGGASTELLVPAPPLNPTCPVRAGSRQWPCPGAIVGVSSAAVPTRGEAAHCGCGWRLSLRADGQTVGLRLPSVCTSLWVEAVQGCGSFLNNLSKSEMRGSVS